MSELRRDPVGIIKDSIARFFEADGLGLAAEAAYRLVFALPALTIFLASVSGLAAQYTGVDVFQALLDRARDAMPAQAFQTLSRVFDSVEQQSGFGFLLVGLAIAVWSGSSAMNALIKGINRAHHLEKARGVVLQRLLAMALTIGLGALIIAGSVLLVFGEQIGDRVASSLGFGGAFSFGLNVARIPIVVALFTGALGVLYGLGPAERMTIRTTYPGAVIATILWIVGIWIFTLYVSIAEPANAYGVLGGVIILLLFLYISSIATIAGAQVNATLARRREGGTGRTERRDHPLDVMSGSMPGEPCSPASRVATWVVLGILLVGAIIGGLRGKSQSPHGPAR